MESWKGDLPLKTLLENIAFASYARQDRAETQEHQVDLGCEQCFP